MIGDVRSKGVKADVLLRDKSVEEVPGELDALPARVSEMFQAGSVVGVGLEAVEGLEYLDEFGKEDSMRDDAQVHPFSFFFFPAARDLVGIVLVEE
jgi:hypothetical protein